MDKKINVQAEDSPSDSLKPPLPAPIGIKAIKVAIRTAKIQSKAASQALKVAKASLKATPKKETEAWQLAHQRVELAQAQLDVSKQREIDWEMFAVTATDPVTIKTTPIKTDGFSNEFELTAKLRWFNRDHSVVAIGGKVLIMRSLRDDHGYVMRNEFFKPKELSTLYSNDTVVINSGGKLKIRNSFDWWLEQKERRSYPGGVVFSPLINPATLRHGEYNLWCGFALEKKAGDWSLLRNHILDVICGGNGLLFEYLLNWCAYTLQKADRPAGVAVVLRGLKGVGKGILGNFLLSIWGQHGIQITNPKHLTGNFNQHLMDKCFVFADEAYFAGDRVNEGVLKGLITENHLNIEPKGVNMFSVNACFKILMATNSDWAVPVSSDERRFIVLDVSDKRKGDLEYFAKLSEHCKLAGTKAAFLNDMLYRDIKAFNPQNVIETAGMKDQRLYSLDSVGQFIFDGLSEGHWGIEYKDKDGDRQVSYDWHDMMAKSDLYSAYLYFCDMTGRRSEYSRRSRDYFSKYLHKVFGNSRRLCSKLDGTPRQRAIVLGDLDTARKLFADHEKVAFEIDTDTDTDTDITPEAQPTQSAAVVEVTSVVYQLDNRVQEICGVPFNKQEFNWVLRLLTDADKRGHGLIDLSKSFIDRLFSNISAHGLPVAMAIEDTLEFLANSLGVVNWREG